MRDALVIGEKAWAVPFWALATAEKRPHEFEYRMLAADGRTVWLRDIVSVVVENDRPVTLRGVMVDITERKRAEEAVREKEEQYRAIFESTGDGLIISDLDGYVVEANPAACALHGYAREEFVGLHGDDFHPPEHRHTYGAYTATVAAGHEFHTQGPHLHLRKDGTPFPVEVHGRTFAYNGQPHVLGSVKDITERVQAYQLLEQRVAERTRELSTLLDISRTIASTLELTPLLRLLLEQIKLVADYSRASVGVVEGENLTTLGTSTPAAAETPDELTGVRYPLARIAPIWEIISRGEPVILPDLHADGPLERCFREAAGVRYATRFGDLHAWLAVPLRHRDQVIGLLALSSTTPGAYTPRHAALIMAIANQAAIAIENARLYEQAQQLAALEERQRLARELHDSVSQALYGIVLGAQTARTLLNRDPGQLAGPLEYVHGLAEAGLAEMRALIFELRPESLETEGLVAALTKQAAALGTRHEIEVETAFDEEPSSRLAVKEALYRIAQEALHNVVKHAGASRVEVRLTSQDAVLILEVHDDGVGFEAGGTFPGHLGLTSMRERASAAGGTLEVESTPGHGTAIRARIPYRPATLADP
jgi:PAS domain S-box-containing protein